MYYSKRYLQFNNLVFDGYDMISSTDEQVTYKETDAQSYSHTHGSYMPYKSDYLYVNAGSVSMTLTFHMKKIPCEDRPYYLRFVDQELGRPGRLWAIKNGEIIWAFASVRSKHPIDTNEPWKAEYDIEFTLPEGVWHKADKQKTFVLPYNVCTMMECKGFEDYNPCEDAEVYDNCCEIGQQKKFWENFRDRCFCCCVDTITKDMMLCYHLKELQQFYGCDTPFQLVYDCDHAEKFKDNDFLGQKFCIKNTCEDHIIASRFYSETDMPTDKVEIVLVGHMKDPMININGNLNVVKGEYDGVLHIKPSGDIYYSSDECCDGTLLDPEVWIIPKGADYGWTIYPQMNSLIIDLNICCDGNRACAYVQMDNITA